MLRRRRRGRKWERSQWIRSSKILEFARSLHLHPMDRLLADVNLFEFALKMKMHYIAIIFGSDQHQVLCNKEILGVGALCLLQCHHGWIPEAAELTTCKKVLVIDG